MVATLLGSCLTSNGEFDGIVYAAGWGWVVAVKYMAYQCLCLYHQ